MKNVFFVSLSLYTLLALSFPDLIQGERRNNERNLLEEAFADRLSLCEEVSGETTMKVYIFNLTNPGEFQNVSSAPADLPKANFEEIQPVVYREERKRENCSIAVQDFSISFKEVRTLLQDSKDNTLTELINTVNIPFLMFSYELFDTHDHTESDVLTCMRTLATSGEKYIKENVTIQDFLTKGVDVTEYQNFIVHQTSFINMSVFPELEKESFALLSDLRVPKTWTLDSEADTFGKISQLDGSDQMPWKMWDEQDGDSDTTMISKSSGKNKGKMNPICSQLTGTDGRSHFYGEITNSSTRPLHFFFEEFCGVVTLTFQEQVNFDQDISAFKFGLSKDFLDATECFCQESDEPQEACLPRGAIDGKYCQIGRPYIVSYPHFLDADMSYTQTITGMSADPYIHQSYFIVEPTTGTVLESNRKFQLNVNLTKLPREDAFLKPNSVPNTIFPVFWAEKHFKLDSVKVKELKSFLVEKENSKLTTTTEATTKNNVPSDPETTTTTSTLTSADKDKNDNSVEEMMLHWKLNEIWSNFNGMIITLSVCLVFLCAVMLACTFIIFRMLHSKNSDIRGQNRNNIIFPPTYEQYTQDEKEQEKPVV